MDLVISGANLLENIYYMIFVTSDLETPIYVLNLSLVMEFGFVFYMHKFFIKNDKVTISRHIS